VRLCHCFLTKHSARMMLSELACLEGETNFVPSFPASDVEEEVVAISRRKAKADALAGRIIATCDTPCTSHLKGKELCGRRSLQGTSHCWVSAKPLQVPTCVVPRSRPSRIWLGLLQTTWLSDSGSLSCRDWHCGCPLLVPQDTTKALMTMKLFIRSVSLTAISSFE